jgi:hypothetical protein
MIQEVLDLFEELAIIDGQINDAFMRKNCRRVGLADKQQKLIEEMGEVIQGQKFAEALKKGGEPYLIGRARLADEIIDSVVAAITQGFILGFTPAELTAAFGRTMDKLQRRWLKK